MNRRRALLLCGLHRKRCAQLHGRARASRYAAAGAADAAGLRLFEAGRAKPSAAGAKRTARQVRAYGAGTAKNDLRLRIGKRILSDTERITAKSSGKAAAKAAKGLRCTVRAGQAFSPTLQSRIHPHLFAQKLLRAAVLTQKSGAYAAAHSSRMRAAAAEHKASALYRGHAYAQKLLRPAILAQKTKRGAFARASQPAPAVAERRARCICTKAAPPRCPCTKDKGAQCPAGTGCRRRGMQGRGTCFSVPFAKGAGGKTPAGGAARQDGGSGSRRGNGRSPRAAEKHGAKQPCRKGKQKDPAPRRRGKSGTQRMQRRCLYGGKSTCRRACGQGESKRRAAAENRAHACGCPLLRRGILRRRHGAAERREHLGSPRFCGRHPDGDHGV